MLVGPWFVAYITNEQMGFVFLHGIIIAGRYLPMNTTYGAGLYIGLLNSIVASTIAVQRQFVESVTWSLK